MKLTEFELNVNLFSKHGNKTELIYYFKYPHLVVGAVSSSSPVQALLDFQDYNNVVTTSLGTEIVGGSKQVITFI